MSLTGLTTILAGILALACLIDLPRALREGRTLGGFFLMNGHLKMGGFVACIFSANLSVGNFLIFISSWAFIYGWGGLFWFLVNLTLNIIVYFIFLPACRSYIEDRSTDGTLHQFISSTFGQNGEANRIRGVASATTVLGLLFAIVFELHLASSILSPLISMDPVLLFGLLTALICVYSGFGGFRTLFITDVLQTLVMILGLAAAVVILWALNRLETTTTLTSAYPITWEGFYIGWPGIVGICVVGSGWFLVAMDQWQRACAMRDAKRTRTGMLWYSILIVSFAVVFALVGMFDKTAILPALPGAVKAQATDGANPLVDFLLSSSIVGLPQFASTILYAVVAVAFLAAAMSTANTFLIVCGHSIVSDLLLGIAKRASIFTVNDEQNKLFLAIARGLIVAMGFFIIATWILLNWAGLMTDPLSFFFIAYSIQFALLAPMVFARFPKKWHPPGRAVFHSIWIGVIVSLISGLGFWSRLQFNKEPILGIEVTDWIALTPALTWMAGTCILLVLSSLSRHRGANI